ncbi:hypothetical protein S245_044503, partial [Arachis hypogaea]
QNAQHSPITLDLELLLRHRHRAPPSLPDFRPATLELRASKSPSKLPFPSSCSHRLSFETTVIGLASCLCPTATVPPVNFLSKLVALKPGDTVLGMIRNVMQGKDEGVDNAGNDDEGNAER